MEHRLPRRLFCTLSAVWPPPSVLRLLRILRFFAANFPGVKNRPFHRVHREPNRASQSKPPSERPAHLADLPSVARFQVSAFQLSVFRSLPSARPPSVSCFLCVSALWSLCGLCDKTPSSVPCPLSSVLCPLSSVLCPLTSAPLALFCGQPSVLRAQAACPVRRLSSAFGHRIDQFSVIVCELFGASEAFGMCLGPPTVLPVGCRLPASSAPH